MVSAQSDPTLPGQVQLRRPQYEPRGLLNVTVAGRQWIANLHSHVFCAEHAFALMGPQR